MLANNVGLCHSIAQKSTPKSMACADDTVFPTMGGGAARQTFHSPPIPAALVILPAARKCHRCRRTPATVGGDTCEECFSALVEACFQPERVLMIEVPAQRYYDDLCRAFRGLKKGPFELCFNLRCLSLDGFTILREHILAENPGAGMAPPQKVRNGQPSCWMGACPC